MTGPIRHRVEHADLKNRILILAGGHELPITAMYDVDGDDTTDIDAVVSIAAGSGDLWVSAMIRPHAPYTVH